jgi:Transposase DDE domain group 1
VIDVDSTICPVDGKAKQGAGFGYTKVLGYHPILATRADTGEVLHARMRKGQANTQRGARRFLDELIARVRRAGSTGPLTVRVDAGFWSNDTIVTLNRLDVRCTMAVRTSVNAVAAVIATIDEDAWVDIDYPAGGQAQVADTTYTIGHGTRQVTRRLVVRRTRLTDTVQQRLWPDWRHHAFITDLDGDAVDVDAFHRHHAVIELAIRDLKEGAGLDHVPSGNFHANSAWLQCAVLAHNLIRWTASLGKRPRQRRAHRRPHHAHPADRPPRPTRQPCRATNDAPPRPLAVGQHVHHGPRCAAPAATRPT